MSLTSREQRGDDSRHDRIDEQANCGSKWPQRDYGENSSRHVMKKMQAKSLADLVKMAEALGIGRPAP